MKDDTISRAAVLDEIHKYMEERDYTIGTLYDNICEMPSAQPEQRWISCNERLPKPEEEVLLTFDYKKRRYVETGNIWSDGTAHCYADDYLTPDGRKYRKVVAWMPLPEPWKGEK